MTEARMQTFVDFLDAFTHSPLEHVPSNMAVSDVLLKASADEERRVFEGWGTVEIKDRQGDLIPIEAFEPLMKKLMKRGAPILDSHSNRHVGKVLDYKFKKKNGKKGLWLKGEIFSDFSSDDVVWKSIQRGLITGFSLGGRAQKQELDCDYTSGECINTIKDLEVWEWSVVRKPANPEATIESVNKLAKSDSTFTISKKMGWEECISQMKHEYGDEATAYAVCHSLKNEGMVTAHKSAEKFESAIIDYLLTTEKEITKLDARALLEKCPHCLEYYQKLSKAEGFDEDSALQHIQTKLNKILEEKQKMAAVNVKVQQPEPPTTTEEKQEEAPPAQDMQAVLEEIMKRLAAIEDIVFPKETSAAEEEAPTIAAKEETSEKPPVEKEEDQETDLEAIASKAVAKELKKFFDSLGVSNTPRPLEKTQAPAEKVNLVEESYEDLFKARYHTDRNFRNRLRQIGVR